VVRLIVKKDDKTVNELEFEKGPVRIGRRSINDISLRHPKVSKLHAIIDMDRQGNWTIEDLDSANKTYLNDKAIHKERIKTGDKISITCFVIEVDLEGDGVVSKKKKPAERPKKSDLDEELGIDKDLDIGDEFDIDEELDIDKELSAAVASFDDGLDVDIDLDVSDIEEDIKSTSGAAAEAKISDSIADEDAVETSAGTIQPGTETWAGKAEKTTGDKEKPLAFDGLMVAPREPQIIIRKIGAEKSPPIRFESERMTQFLTVIDAINKAVDTDELLLVLLDAVSKQLGACYAWAALRTQPAGPMIAHAGRLRDGRPLDFEHIPLNEKINEAIERQEYLLLIFSRDMDLEKGKQVRSAIITPISNSNGCYGAIYVNNTFRDEHYDLADVDYLMMVAIHAAAALEKL
jgi:pSer/pThr/pTyr-binding forkhead associated (FHA) protein